MHTARKQHRTLLAHTALTQHRALLSVGIAASMRSGFRCGLSVLQLREAQTLRSLFGRLVDGQDDLKQLSELVVGIHQQSIADALTGEFVRAFTFNAGGWGWATFHGFLIRRMHTIY